MFTITNTINEIWAAHHMLSQIPIPIIQAKFYYIPPLEGTFQSFNSPLQRLSCVMLNYRGNEIMLYQFPTCGELKIGMQKFQMQYRNVNPLPRRKKIGKIPYLSLCGEKYNPFVSSVKDWVNSEFSQNFQAQCNLDLVTLLVCQKTFTKLWGVTK